MEKGTLESRVRLIMLRSVDGLLVGETALRGDFKRASG